MDQFQLLQNLLWVKLEAEKSHVVAAINKDSQLPGTKITDNIPPLPTWSLPHELSHWGQTIDGGNRTRELPLVSNWSETVTAGQRDGFDHSRITGKNRRQQDSTTVTFWKALLGRKVQKSDCRGPVLRLKIWKMAAKEDRELISRRSIGYGDRWQLDFTVSYLYWCQSIDLAVTYNFCFYSRVIRLSAAEISAIFWREGDGEHSAPSSRSPAAKTPVHFKKNHQNARYTAICTNKILQIFRLDSFLDFASRPVKSCQLWS